MLIIDANILLVFIQTWLLHTLQQTLSQLA